MKLLNNPPNFFQSLALHSLLPFSVIFLLCQHSSAGASLSNQTDLLALLEFKHQISNDPHGFFNSWNNSVNFCQWQGVTCGVRHQRVLGLNLSSQNLLGTISPHIGNLSFLRFIYLRNNSFQGEIPQQIGRLSRLRLLALTYNSFGGHLPVNLSRCLDLRVLYLAKNQLVGPIPEELGYLKKLDSLNFLSNSFTGSIPRSFGNLSSLTRISLAENKIVGTIPSELGQLKNLEIITVTSNYNLTGVIHSSLYNISTIFHLGAANNRLTGTFPPNIGLTLPNLQEFSFGGNFFHGEIPISFSNASRLKSLDLSGNRLTGQVPANLGNLQNLSWLNFGANLLDNNASNDLSFITSLTNCSNLELLAIDANNFGGEIPVSVGNLSVQLKTLALGYNRLAGRIPSVLENLGKLSALQLEKNLLSGSIPSSLGKLGNLRMLLLKGNKLSGRIPSSLGNISLIYQLDLSDNKLEGNIPQSIGNCEKLNLLDLSRNSLIGSIPEKVVSIFSLSIALNLSRNSLTGSLPLVVGTLKNIIALDVSDNKLTGNIPPTIGECLLLQDLYMQGNSFNGVIPSALTALRGINILDLSRNNFSGQIPEDIEKLPYLYHLNLSFNDLEGNVPETGVFGNLSAMSVVGNSKLCGGIEELQLPSCRIRKKKSRVPLVGKMVIIASSVFLLFVLIISIIFLRKRRTKGQAYVDSLGERHLRVSYHDLHRATEGFSPTNLIGSGSFGSVYRGKLNQEDDNLVAVKVLNLEKTGASKSFVAECRALRNIRHRNLVKILTYCSSIDSKGDQFKALVYEYMSNGSLDMWLHPHDEECPKSLSLLQRVNIALNVAEAIHYLHDLCELPIIHCDLKPGNILLDNELIAHVGDFGLARLLSKSDDTFTQAQCSSMGIKGSIGYTAPEYGTGGEASKYGDVYSYGVLLLEMFTGKRPTDDMFKDGLNLHNYVKMALDQEYVLMIVDSTLVEFGRAESRYADVEKERDKLGKCVIGVLEIGIGCSAESRKERICMNDVVKDLQHIKTAYLGERIIENTAVASR